MGTRLVYGIDKSLGVTSGEIFKHLDLITVREEGLYQIDPLLRGGRGVDEPLPGGRVSAHGETVEVRDGRSPE